MKVLIVGGGGREHAIAWKLKQSKKVDKLYAVPGNAGISEIAECIGIPAEDIEQIRDVAKEKEIDLVVVGPEVPLAMGIVDVLEEEGIKIFGPNRKCSQLEASKAFTKSFLDRHKIPTAKYKEFTDTEDLMDNLGIFGWPMVIKADGLAAGKGVIIAEDKKQARKAIYEIMEDSIFGPAGDKIVVEEYLEGIESSVLCFVDGSAIVPMESAQDYKRIGDGGKGPNTGGMGTYSPSLLFDKDLEKEIWEKILQPTFAGFKEDNLDFRGVLFVGIMIGKEGPKVIEFNNRFGDPETQVVLPRLENDLLDVLIAVTEDRLEEIDFKWSDKKAICVVMASKGYPNLYEKGKPISGFENVDDGIIVFHAGTKYDDKGNIVTNGGRVLGVTAMGDTHDEAREKVYKNVERILFDGAVYRKDIGLI